MRRRLVAVSVALLLLAAGARAQERDPSQAPLRTPLLIQLPSPTTLSQHPVPALTAGQMTQLQQAIQLRDAGLLDRAREAFTGLLAEAPHHPLVLSELARTLLARQDFAAAERLGRSERAAQKDSLLLGRELSLALERLGRPRDAAQVAIEMWAADGAQSEWAGGTVLRLTPTDPRGIREALRRSVERLPDRTDLARGLARLEWQIGEGNAALKTLETADRGSRGPGLRWSFAEELLRGGTLRDSTGARDALLALAADTAREPVIRMASARRAWEIARSQGSDAEVAPLVTRALDDVPVARWPTELVAGLARGLRGAGMTGEARTLLEKRGAGAGHSPELALEQALADLRDGPPQKALPALERHAGSSPEATFRFAEALFFAGLTDSATAWYQRISKNPDDPFAGASLERIYLIEQSGPRVAAEFGRLAYEDWRGEAKRATALADSLYHGLPQGPSWAHAALLLSARLEAAGEWRGALAPLLAVADSVPEDRLAPVARQRAGDLYLLRLKDEALALEQYEECLARYPRAWNAPEVRRRIETLRRERRF